LSELRFASAALDDRACLLPSACTRGSWLPSVNPSLKNIESTPQERDHNDMIEHES